MRQAALMMKVNILIWDMDDIIEKKEKPRTYIHWANEEKSERDKHPINEIALKKKTLLHSS